MYNELTKDQLLEYLKRYSEPNCHSIYFTSKPKKPKATLYIINPTVQDYDTMTASMGVRVIGLIWDKPNGFTPLAKEHFGL